MRPARCVFLATLGATGCAFPDGRNVLCTADVRPAIVVTITDSVTLMPAAGVAAGEVQDGVYRDSLRPYAAGSNGMISRYAAGERTGTYTIRVSAPAYVDWQRVGVSVGRDQCHVQTATVAARLQPAP